MRVLFVVATAEPHLLALVERESLHLLAEERDSVHVLVRPPSSRSSGSAVAAIQGLKKKLGPALISTLNDVSSVRGPAGLALLASDQERIVGFAKGFNVPAIVYCASEKGFDDRMRREREVVALAGPWAFVRFAARDSELAMTIERSALSMKGQPPWLAAWLGRLVAEPTPPPGALKGSTVLGLDGAARLPRREEPRSARPGPRVEVGAARPLVPGLVVESPSQNQVIHSNRLWVKGWVESAAQAASHVLVEVNGKQRATVPLGEIRGDVYGRPGTALPVSFEGHVELLNEVDGCSVDVTLSLMLSDGTRAATQALQVWLDPSELRFTVPILRGHVRFASVGEITGVVWTDGGGKVDISLVQDGRLVARRKVGPGGFSFLGLLHLNDTRPVHLYVKASGAEHYWTTLVPRAAESPQWGLPTVGGRAGVAQDEKVEVLGDLLSSSKRIFVNGRLLRVEPDDAGRLRLPATPATQIVEFQGQDGERSAHRVLRLPPETHAPQEGAVFLSLEPIRARASAGEGPARVVLIRQEASPTDELYVLAPFERLQRERRLELEVVSFKEEYFSATRADRILRPGACVVVSRYIHPKWLDMLATRRAHLSRVVYLVDDDLPAALDTPSLPLAYRQRMSRVALGQFQLMLDLCDLFVVTSDHLRSRFDSPKTRLLRPSFVPDGPFRPGADSDEIRIAYHGTEAHRDDIAMLAPMLVEFLEANQNVTLQFTTGQIAPCLAKHPRVEHTRPMSWNDYRAHRANSFAHIALAPLLRSGYNSGKSFVKILDIAQLSAVGVYSTHSEYAPFVSHERDGLLVANDPRLWRKALEWLISDPGRLKTMRRNARKLAQRIGALGPLEAFWAQELCLSPGGPSQMTMGEP